MGMSFEWADAGRMKIWNDAALGEVSEDEVQSGEIGVSLDTGSNGVMIWGSREALIEMAENLARRLRAGEGASQYGELRLFVLGGPTHSVMYADGDIFEASQLERGDRFRDNFIDAVPDEREPAGNLWQVFAGPEKRQTSEGLRYSILARQVIED